MTFRQYLVLAGVTVFAASGDSLLSVGMKQVGQISFHRLPAMILAFLNPYVGFVATGPSRTDVRQPATKRDPIADPVSSRVAP